jgi:hypothetical protein
MRGLLLFAATIPIAVWSQSVTTTFSIPGGVHSMASNMTLNKLYVQTNSQPTDYVVDGATNTQTPLGSSQFGATLVVNPATSQIYTISSDGKKVYDIDGTTNAQVALNLPGLRYQQVLVDENTDTVYVSGIAPDPSGVNPFLFSVWVIDGSTNSLTRTITLPVSYTVVPFDAQTSGDTVIYALGGRISGQASGLVLNKATKTLYGVYYTAGGQPVDLVNTPSGITGVSDGGAFLAAIDTIASTVSFSRLSDNFYLSTLAKDYPCYSVPCSVTNFIPVSTGVDDSSLNRVYVLSDHGTVDVLDAATGQVKTERLMGASQHTGFANMVVDPVSHYVFVADNETGSNNSAAYIYILDGTGLTDPYPLLLTSPVSCAPGQLVLDSALNELFVAGCQGGIPIVKADTLGLEEIPTPGVSPTILDVNPNSGTLWASDGVNLTVIGLNSGNGAPALTLNPKTLNFPFPQNSLSSSATFYIQNTGTAPLQITNFEFPTGIYFAQSNQCQNPLPAGTSCPVTVTWTPPATVAAATSSFTVDVAAPATSSSVSLQTAAGTGFFQLNWSGGTFAVGPPVTFNVPVLDYVNGAWTTQSTLFELVIQNQGDAPMTVTAIQNVLSSSVITGSINQSDTCSGTIAPHSSCRVTMTTELGIPYLLVNPIPGSITVNAVEGGTPQSLTASYLINFQL